ncbi:putative transcriptional regulator [Sphingomonas jejuensis]|uniref:Transcriptional regulator n=1 Tax=Sphingomonas jejuensis TaxID=904715 RepID=A0ABX0XKK6_9SPHN|nr:putative transcriptional regulator [Sphingomonas jejuensis]
MAVITAVLAARTDQRLTQAQLAEAVGVSRQTINSIETGRFEPSLELALKLARHFDQPVETLFTLHEEG